jgi:serine/threonine protein kinase
MPETSDELVARLAVGRGYITREQLVDAKDVQQKAAELGLPETLAHILVAKGMLTQLVADALESEAAVATGEARQIGDYTVVEKLGQGGMGAVYRAHHTKTGQDVALKILPPSMADEEMVARFKREAGAAARLNHGNIVKYVEFGFDQKRRVYFCALEYIDGEDLCARLSRIGTIPEETAVDIAYHIADALQHAYKNGLVHRDIKPENIMITKSGTPKLLDLGLAVHTAETSTRLTQQGLFVGSPMYASPEQARGEAELDTRSDIYALGATLYDMLTGQPLFDDDNSMALLQKHLSDRAPWPADLNPKLSDGVCRIVAKMLAKDPDDRYAYPIELMAELRMLRHGEKPKLEPGYLKGTSLLAPIGAAIKTSPRRRRKPKGGRGSTRSSRSGSSGRLIRQTKVGGKTPPKSSFGNAMVVVGSMGGLAAAVVLLALAANTDTVDNNATTSATLPVARPPAPVVVLPVAPRQRDVPSRPDVVAHRVPPKDGSARTAALALAFAQSYEEEHAANWSESIVLYETVEDDFPGSPEAGLARIAILRLQSQHAPRPQGTGAFEIIWLVDPEDGVPAEWSVGGFESTGLPPGSRGAVRQTERGIAVKRNWHNGLFAVERGYRFNCVLKRERAGWFQFMISTRTTAVGGTSANAFWRAAPSPPVGQWVLISTPLESFVDGSDPIHLGETAWNVAIDTGSSGDLGIVVDKMWVDRPTHAAAAAKSSPARARYRLYGEEMSWDDAKAFCEREGGHLVTISSRAENDHVLSLMGERNINVWLGLSDAREEGTWEWVTGEPFVYANWGPDEPNDTDAHEDCAHISAYPNHFRGWNDCDASERFAFVCEFEDGEASGLPRDDRRAVPLP